MLGYCYLPGHTTLRSHDKRPLQTQMLNQQYDPLLTAPQIPSDGYANASSTEITAHFTTEYKYYSLNRVIKHNVIQLNQL